MTLTTAEGKLKHFYNDSVFYIMNLPTGLALFADVIRNALAHVNDVSNAYTHVLTGALFVSTTLYGIMTKYVHAQVFQAPAPVAPVAVQGASGTQG